MALTEYGRNKRISAYIAFIEKYQIDNGYCPSIRDFIGIDGVTSVSTIANFLKRMEEKGFIKTDNIKPRTIRSTRLEYKYK